MVEYIRRRKFKVQKVNHARNDKFSAKESILGTDIV